MNKKGQLYFIIILIIASFVIGIISISNYFSEEKTTRIYNLGKQLEIEGEKTLSYDLYNKQNKFDNFTKNFSDYAGKDFNIIYISGRQGNIEAYNYSNEQKTILPLTEESNKVIFKLNEKNYTFDVNKGENFNFIISENKKGSNYIIVG